MTSGRLCNQPLRATQGPNRAEPPPSPGFRFLVAQGCLGAAAATGEQGAFAASWRGTYGAVYDRGTRAAGCSCTEIGGYLVGRSPRDLGKPSGSEARAREGHCWPPGAPGQELALMRIPACNLQPGSASSVFTVPRAP